MNSAQLHQLRVAADISALAFIGYRLYKKIRVARLEEATRTIRENRLDIMIDDSFPASDPPSYGHGGLSIGH